MSKTDQKFKEEPKTITDKVALTSVKLEKISEINKTMLFVNMTLAAILLGAITMTVLR